MTLSRQDVQRIALLARLEFTDEELDRLTDELAHVVNYVEQLGELATDDVEPMAHAADIFSIFREDEPRPSLPREAALANAPKADGECFLVPPVL